MSSAPPPSPSSHDDATEAIPRVASETKPIPVVRTLPVDATREQQAAVTRAAAPPAAPEVAAAAPETVAVAPPAAGPPAAAPPAAGREATPEAPEADETSAPGATAAAPATAAPEPATSAPPAAPSSPPAPSSGTGATPASRSRQLALLAGLALLAVVVGAVAGFLLRDGGSGSARPSAASSATRIDAEVSSVDPSGGSGLRRTGNGWRTQTYRSADFGGLKPGVGLLLDLGSARALTSVRFEAAPAGATIGLRAADERPTSGADLEPVGKDVEASGRTALDGSSGGTHRYWLVWVSGLGSRDGGYGLTLSDPVVTGPAAG